MSHPSHPDVDRRLARAAGHIEGVRRMIAQEKPCADLLQQMKAVISALEKARRMLLEDHVLHCITDAMQKNDAPWVKEELEKIMKQLWL